MEQYELEEEYTCGAVVSSPRAVYREMRDIKQWDKEALVAFYLNSQHVVISREVLCIGTANAMIIHPREVFRTAIVRNAHAVIVSHNHPSGCQEPSEEDLRITRNLRQAGDIIGIELLDHVIVTRQGYVSLREAGELI